MGKGTNEQVLEQMDKYRNRWMGKGIYGQVKEKERQDTGTGTYIYVQGQRISTGIYGQVQELMDRTRNRWIGKGTDGLIQKQMDRCRN